MKELPNFSRALQNTSYYNNKFFVTLYNDVYEIEHVPDAQGSPFHFRVRHSKTNTTAVTWHISNYAEEKKKIYDRCAKIALKYRNKMVDEAIKEYSKLAEKKDESPRNYY